MEGKTTRFCPDCGYEHGGAKFCPRCGTPQSGTLAPSESADESHAADSYPGDYYSSGAANNMPNGDMGAQPESSSSGWYYSARGQRIGPLDREAVASQIFQGGITHDTLVWREGLPDWRRAAETELAGLLRGTSLGSPRVKRTRREKFKQLGVFIVAMMLLFATVAELSRFTNTGTSTNPAVSDPPAQPATSSRCEGVPTDIVFNLEQGLTITGGGSVRDVQAVRSNDYRKVWFVSADLEGPGMEGEQIATWTTNSLDPQPPAGFASVNDVALKHSNWANGPNTDVQLSMDDDGAEESQECASVSGP